MMSSITPKPLNVLLRNASTLLYFSIIWIGNHQLEDQDKDHLDGRITTIVITDSLSDLSKTKVAFWKNCNVYTTRWKTIHTCLVDKARRLTVSE